MGVNEDAKTSALPAFWQFAMVPTNTSAGIVSASPMYPSLCQPVTMADSFKHGFCGQPLVPQNLGFGHGSAARCVPAAMTSPGMFLPAATADLRPRPPHFPTDSALIERAVRFSCVNGGNISSFVGSSAPTSAAAPYQLQKTEQRMVEGVQTADRFVQGSRSANANSPTAGCGSSPSEIGTNKRKRIDQDVETDQAQQRTPTSLDSINGNPDAKLNKSSGKNSKDGPGAPKEDYVHVRARRGQATNSHSLAERVRREKISERMKYLQNLVPGCSKVTGKAVMLDEIINYVQSLQRQVEFLSMKLAAVNPKPDYNIGNLPPEDRLHARGCGPSSVAGFSQGIVQPQLHPCQQGFLLNEFSDMVNTSDVLRKVMNTQLSTVNGHKIPTMQIQKTWNKGPNNSMQQIAYGGNALLNTQEPSRKPCDDGLNT